MLKKKSFNPSLILQLLLLALVCVFTLSQPATAAAEELDKTMFRPVLGLEAKTTGTAIPGGEFYLTLVIRNFSQHPAFDASFELKTLHDKTAGVSGLDPFAYRDLADQEMLIEKIEGNATISVTIPFQVKADALQRDDYRLQVDLKSKDVFFEENTVRSSAVVTVPVSYGNLKPRLVVKNAVLDPADPDPEKPFTAKLYLENINQVDVRNVQVEFDGGANFQVLELNSKKYLNQLAAGKTTTVQFAMQGKENRPGNAVKILLTYDYLGNEAGSQTETINLPLPLPLPATTTEGADKPLVRIDSFTVVPTDPGKSASLTLAIKNSGTKTAGEIRLVIEGNSHLYPLNVSNVRYLTDLAPGEGEELAIPLGLNPQPDTPVYPLNVTLTFNNELGTKQPDVLETLSISSQMLGVAGKLTGYAGIPRVIISKYTLSHNQILAGNTVTLRLFIENTNPRDVHNVKISLVVPPVDGDKGGTVFSPVNSSNSFYVDTIAGKQTTAHTIDLFVDPSSAAKTYIVPVKIVYEDGDGNVLTEEDTVNVPVTQESRLQVLSVELPPVAFMGQPVPVSAEFVNVGKVPLDNFMVTIEGDFPKENATYFLGQFQIGASDYFQGFINPQEPGTLAGTLVFSYLDNNNQPARVERPFELQVEEMSPEMMGPPPEDLMKPGFPQGPKSPVAIVKGLIPYGTTAILALTAGLIYRHKRRRQKEEELFHE